MPSGMMQPNQTMEGLRSKSDSAVREANSMLDSNRSKKRTAEGGTAPEASAALDSLRAKKRAAASKRA